MTTFATIRVAAIQATPVALPPDKEVFGRGGAAVIEPSTGDGA